MIIKFMEKDHWVVFGEIDHLEYGELDKSENAGLDSSVICFEQGNSPAKEKYNFVEFFTKNMTEATIIHAYSPIYLMNDNGKTIETI